jgi:opacity protein-like surface antigen
MHRTFPRSALIASCAAAAATAAFSAAPALAAVAATTGTVTHVTADSADLNGTVSTGGAITEWEFAYSLANNPFVGGFSTGSIIPVGTTAATSVVGKLTKLLPSTRYSYELVATNVTYGNTYYLNSPVYGLPLTFKTKGPGTATLTSTKLKVKHGRVVVGIKCSKAYACDGGVLAITTRHKHKKVACGSATFSIRAGKKKTITTSKVSATCKALLVLAPKHKIHAGLTAGFTYQKGISKVVSLTLA